MPGLRRRALGLVALMIAATAVAMPAAARAAAIGSAGFDWVAGAAGGAAIFAWLWFLLRGHDATRRDEALKRPLRRVLPPIAALLTFGQVFGDSTATYPFAGWHMFSSASPAHRYSFHEVEGQTASGETVRLVPGRLFPSVGNHLLFTRLQQVFAPLPGPLARHRATPEQVARADAALRALAARHNRLHPETPVTRISLSRIRLQFDPDTGAWGVLPAPVLSRPLEEP
jgi:hypothetical protein